MASAMNEQVLQTFLAAHARLATAMKGISGQLGGKTPKVSQKAFQELIDSSAELLKESVKLSVLLGVKLEAGEKKTAAKKTTAKKAAAKKEEPAVEEAEQAPAKKTTRKVTAKAEPAEEAEEKKPAARKTAAKKSETTEKKTTAKKRAKRLKSLLARPRRVSRWPRSNSSDP